ncbi:MAG: cysteine rich repeat-containing protein [Desulfobacterales bacterium]
MRIVILIGVILSIMIVFTGIAPAQQKGPVEAVAQGLVETVATGCEKELVAYCKDVTPGEGRVLACLYAHEDKLSARCEYALFDAAAQLDRAISTLTYVANECVDDLDKYCAKVAVGEGRLLDCLKKNDKKVSKRCKQALKDTGMK